MYAPSGKSNVIISNLRFVLLVAAALVLTTVAVLQPHAQPSAANHGTPIGSFGGMEETKLKTDLQTAMIRSIDIDIQLYTAQLDLALAQRACQKKVAELRDAIATLNQERKKVCQLSPFTMELPEQRRLVIDTNAPYNYGAALSLASKRKDSPVYYIAGIAGDDLSVLEHRGRQPITVYILRHRFYNDKDDTKEPASYYVYITLPGEAGPGFSSPDY